MKIYSIIPARGGSKGIKNKNIISIGGMPLIAHSILQSINTKDVNKTFVSTDCEKIAEISRNYGANIIVRPKSISGDYSPSEDALKHFLGSIKTIPDIIVFLQATSPFRSINDIQNAINLFIEQNADSLFSSKKIEGFIWQETQTDLHPINYDFKSRPMRQQKKNEFFEENGSFYIFKPHLILENNSRLGGKILHYPMNIIKSIQIDYPEDIPIVENIFSSKKTIVN